MSMPLAYKNMTEIYVGRMVNKTQVSLEKQPPISKKSIVDLTTNEEMEPQERVENDKGH